MATAPWTTPYLPHSYRPAPSRWPALLQAWLPVLLFSFAFAVESTATFGANHTSAPLHSLFHSLFGSAIDRQWSELHHILRKTGHFLGYGTFSLICFRGIRRSLIQIRKFPCGDAARLWISHGMAIAATFLVATADEIHQTFLPNRTGCFSDVLLDTAGAAAFQTVLILALIGVSRLRGRAGFRLSPDNRTALAA
jgi:VanZ family protein